VVELQKILMYHAQSILESMPGHVRASGKAKGAEESE
jgi:hypothetical protein